METRLTVVKPVPYEPFEDTVCYRLELIERHADILSVMIKFDRQ